MGGRAVFIKRLCVLAAVFALAKAAVALGLDEAACALARDAAASDKTVEKLMSISLGVPLSAVPQSSIREYFYGLEDAPEIREEIQPPPPETAAEAPEMPEVIETSLNTGDGIAFKNETDYEIDASRLLSEKLTFSVAGDSPRVLIIHTHGSEAFDMSDGLTYEESDPWRCEDREHSVIALGDRITEIFTEKGIPVVHDRELYDYPSYAGSYNRAAESISRYLDEYPEISVVLDVHRDAVMDDAGNVYKTTADINGEKSAQVLVLSGTDFSGLYHPDWRENLKLAVRLQNAMNEKYPGLARPVTVSRFRYNQQYTKGSLIIEIGMNGNTLTEALAAAGYFADCACDVLLKTPE